MYLLTVTVPARATRPRSFRPRSTSITCSARSFGIALELFGEERVLARIGAARAGPGDRMRREPVALHLEQELRGRPDHLEGRGPDEEQVRTRIHAPQRPVDIDPVDGPSGRGVRGQVERLATSEHDLDRLARGDGVLGDLDRLDVGVATEARLDRPLRGDHGGAVRRRPAPPLPDRALGRGPASLRGGRPSTALEGVEDGRLGDAIATLEVRRVRVQRRDGRERVGEVVEDEHQVGLDEGGGRHADRVAGPESAPMARTSTPRRRQGPRPPRR